MFWKNKEMEEQVRTMTQKNRSYLQTISELDEENSKIKTENERLNKQIIKYQAIFREQTPLMKDGFKPAMSSFEAVSIFQAQFKGQFKERTHHLDDVEVDILNVFLQKIHSLKQGQYKPSAKAIASCDEFFNFHKPLTTRQYLTMFYSLLDIKMTSRRFEFFNQEVNRDQLMVMIEILFAYIEP